jgi:hypothetical protein
LNVKSYTSVVGSTGGEESGPAFGVSFDDGSPAGPARFCLLWIRRAAFSFCRSNRRVSFWRFLKVSTRSFYGAKWNGTFPLPARLSSLTPAALGSARESAAPTFSLGARLVNVERAPPHVGAIQRRNRPVRLGRIRHLDESETARTPSVSVRHQVHTIHPSVRLEKRSQRRFGSGKIQIAYEDILHVVLLLSFNRAS